MLLLLPPGVHPEAAELGALQGQLRAAAAQRQRSAAEHPEAAELGALQGQLRAAAVQRQRSAAELVLDQSLLAAPISLQAKG